MDFSRRVNNIHKLHKDEEDTEEAQSIQNTQQNYNLIPFLHRKPLDGLRGIAAIFVLLFHSKVSSFTNGYAGVDIFFVLSGYLITSLILREIYSTNTLNFFAFYTRRIKRLLPSAFIVILITSIFYKLNAPNLIVYQNRSSFQSAISFSENWHLILQSKDYFAEGNDQSPIMHFWSLNLEEQFYFIFPLFIYFLFSIRLIKSSNFTIPFILFVIFLHSLVTNYITSLYDPSYAYFGTQFRLYQLLMGSLLSFFIFQYENSKNRSNYEIKPNNNFNLRNYFSIFVILQTISLTSLFIISTSYYSSLSSFKVGFISSISTFLLIISLEFHPNNSFISKFLTLDIFLLFGKYSYSLYLWHYPIIIIGNYMKIFSKDYQLMTTISIFFISFVFSKLSFILYEDRINRLQIKSKKSQKICITIAILITLSLYFTVPFILKFSPEKEEFMRKLTDTSSLQRDQSKNNFILNTNSFPTKTPLPLPLPLLSSPSLLPLPPETSTLSSPIPLPLPPLSSSSLLLIPPETSSPSPSPSSLSSPSSISSPSPVPSPSSPPSPSLVPSPSNKPFVVVTITTESQKQIDLPISLNLSSPPPSSSSPSPSPSPSPSSSSSSSSPTNSPLIPPTPSSLPSPEIIYFAQPNPDAPPLFSFLSTIQRREKPILEDVDQNRKRNTVIVGGDSYASEWEKLFEIYQTEDITMQFVLEWGCPWLYFDNYQGVPTDPFRIRDICANLHRLITANVQAHQPYTTILFSGSLFTTMPNMAGQFSYPASPRWVAAVEEGAVRLLDSIYLHTTQIAIVLPHALINDDIPLCLGDLDMDKMNDFDYVNEKCSSSAKLAEGAVEFKLILEKIETLYPNVRFISLDEFICPNLKCNAIDSEGNPTFRDLKHIHFDHAITLRNDFERAFANKGIYLSSQLAEADGALVEFVPK